MAGVLSDFLDALSSATTSNPRTTTSSSPITTTTRSAPTPPGSTTTSSSITATLRSQTTTTSSSSASRSSSSSSSSSTSSTSTSSESTTSQSRTSSSTSPIRTITSVTETTVRVPTPSSPLSTSTSPSLSTSATASASSAASKDDGSPLTTGMIAGIAVAGALVLIAALILIIRAIKKSRRQNRLSGMNFDGSNYKGMSYVNAMPAGVAPNSREYDDPDPDKEANWAMGSVAPTLPTRQSARATSTYNNGLSNAPYYVTDGAGAGMAGTGAGYYNANTATPYDTFGQVRQYPAPYAPPAQTPAAIPASAGVRDGGMTKVKQGFVRSMEDELAIQSGDNLFVVQVYDDGWCLCEDQRGEKGAVPVRCLDGNSGFR